MEQFETILARMQNEYEQTSGQSVTQASDSDFRLQVLAGEITRLQAELAWLANQAVPWSAQGEWLTRHGELRGVTRNAATHARGTLKFSRYLPLSFDAIIPKGTVCAVSGDEPIEFETTEDVTLPAESLTVTAPAQAVVAGVSGNVTSGQINTLVSETDLADYVTNTAAFSGGREAETDDEYRVRVLKTYQNPATALNSAWYRNFALSQSGITAAQAVPCEDGANTVSIYCWGEGSAPTQATLTAMQSDLNEQRDIGVTVTVKAAETVTYPLKMRLRMASGADFAAAKAQAIHAAETYFAGVTVGDAVSTDAISRMVLRDPAIAKLEFPASVRDLSAAAGVLPILGEVTVEEIS